MARGDRKKRKSLSDLTPKARRGLVVGTASLVALGSLLGMTSFVQNVTRPPEKEVTVSTEVARTNNVTAWSRNFLLLYLSGTGAGAGSSRQTSNEFTIDAMSSAPLGSEAAGTAGIKLPPTSLETADITPVNAVKYEVQGYTLWRMTMAATAKVPGTNKPQRFTYEFDVVEVNGGYQVTALPRMVGEAGFDFTTSSVYSNAVQEGNPIMQSAQAFVDAWLVPGSGTGLGSTTSAEFGGTPPANSPFKKATVQSVTYFTPYGGVDVTMPKPGDAIEALITVRAEVSSTTWNTMQFPVTMSVLENGQWVISAMSSVADISGVRADEEDGSQQGGDQFQRKAE